MTIDHPDKKELRKLTESNGPLALVAQAVAIAERLKESKIDIESTFTSAIQSLYREQSGSFLSVDAANRRFTDDIRAGALDFGDQAKHAHVILQEHAKARLEISNPDYSDVADPPFTTR